jgi:hypothetical protein
MKAEEILGEACWKGYHKKGMKKMFGKTYPNCVKNESEEIKEFIDVNKTPENFDVYTDSYGADYDFTVSETRIEVTFKEYNENYYILAFENKTQSRPDTHAATGTERDTVFKIFNGVAYCLNHFIARHPKTEVIVMGAKSNEPSRIKLYDRAAKFFEQMGFKAVTDPVQQKKIFSDDASDYKLYIYKKKIATEMTSESTKLRCDPITESVLLEQVDYCMHCGNLVLPEASGNLHKWFKDKWVNIGKKVGGKHPPCGTSGSKSGYAKCVPAAKARSMSASQKKSATTRKRRAQNAAGRGGKDTGGNGKAPIRVSTKAKS